MDHKRKDRTPPPLAMVNGSMGRQQQHILNVIVLLRRYVDVIVCVRRSVDIIVLVSRFLDVIVLVARF